MKIKYLTGTILFYLYLILMILDLTLSFMVFNKLNNGVMLETNPFGGGLKLIIVNLFCLFIVYLLFINKKFYLKHKPDLAFIYTSLLTFLSVARIKAISGAIIWLRKPALQAEIQVSNMVQSGALTETAKNIHYFSMVWQTMLQPLILVIIIWLIYRLSYKVEAK